MLVADIGFSEAAQRTGIKRDTLYKWGQRNGWKEPIQHAKTKAVQFVQSPSDAHANVLADYEGQTRIKLAKYAKNAAGAIHKSVHPTKWTKEAHDIAKTMAIVHRQGEHGQQPGFSLNILNMGSLDVSVGDSGSSSDPVGSG